MPRRRARTVEDGSKFESYGMLETATSGGWKAKDAIEWFHGIGRLDWREPNAAPARVEKCFPLKK